MINIILVLSGAALLGYAIAICWALHRQVERSIIGRACIIILALTCLFMIGYLIFFVRLLVTMPQHTFDELLISLIFFFGAVFVVVVLKINYNLILNIHEKNVNLTKTNRELEAALGDLYAARAILDSIGDGVFVIGKDRKIILFNKMASRLSGYGKKEALGKKYDEILKFVCEDGGKANNRFVDDCMTKGKITEMANHTLLVEKDGKKIPVADSAAPVKNREGKVLGCVVVFRDITLSRQVDRMKSEFVSVASHQLRTPLTAIKLFVEFLANGDAGKLNKLQADYVNNVKESNERMIQLVSDLLNISRLESGRLRVEPEMIQLEDFIRKCIDEAGSSAEQPGKGKIIFTKPEGKLPQVALDPTLIRQVLNNLLTNALRYCRISNCQIQVKLEAQDGYYRIGVTDNGIGIPAADQKRIFERFFRARNAALVEAKGTGLGLYFAKMIIETAGGKIWFESEEGKGTTFYFTIPAAGMKPKSGEKGLAA